MALTKPSQKPPVKRNLNEQDKTGANTEDIINNVKNNHIELRSNDNKRQEPWTGGGANRKSSDKYQANKQDHPSSQQPQHAQQDGEVGLLKKFVSDCLLYLIMGIITLYDLISQPVFYFKYKVYEKQHDVDKVQRSKQVDPTDPNSPWRQVNIDACQHDMEAKADSFDTYSELMQHSFKEFDNKPCYGYRDILKEKWVKKVDSDKLLKQVQLSDYRWVTYGQFELQIEALRKGLLLEGVRAGDKVTIYADTRPEWQIAAQALTRMGCIVVTMYSTLGIDGIVHCINETEVDLVVTQRDKVSKLLRLKPKLSKLKKIFYFDPTQLSTVMESCVPLKVHGPKNGDSDKFGAQGSVARMVWTSDFECKDVECKSFGQILSRGRDEDPSEIARVEEENRPGVERMTKESIAVIMYTSGSTGIPKGVLISHDNIKATIKAFTYVTKDFIHKPEENSCTAYLPLAHIFEFCIESTMLVNGCKFGFATPHTLTDKSPGLLPGQTGDLTLLKPTVMIIVPLILDRIVQGIKQVLRGQSYFKEQLVLYLIKYKIYWQKRHYETPIVNKVICSKMAAALGGRTKYVICGSAPLSGEIQSFVRAALSLKLPQGFGTTETCAATACQQFDDQTTDNVGLPVIGCQVKLEPWIEGNYRPTDKPNPRGEIVVGGQMIAQGYFKLPEQNKEAFYVDCNGVRWYRTGDIGEFLPNGNLKIIDRKKDLVKLQNGEYISLGKVESVLKSNPYTDNFCIYANSLHNYVLALGPANETSLKTLAQQIIDEYKRHSPSMKARNEDNQSLNSSAVYQQMALEDLKDVLASYELDEMNNNDADKQYLERKMSSLSTNSTTSTTVNERLKRLCENKLLQARVLDHIKKVAVERGLTVLETPKKLLLLAEEWTEDKNLVTAAMKIRRNYIYKRYERELENMYSRNVN